MDLLGSIFAYLGSVTAIIAAFAFSYDVLIYAPLNSTGPHQPMAMIVKPSGAKPRVMTAASRARTIVPSKAPPAAVSREEAAKTARQIEAEVQRREAYRRELARRRRTRWLVQQARAREWASEQAPAPLGYADAPPPAFGGNPFQ
jgi:hypothetical protein